jgi:hypothetical protein
MEPSPPTPRFGSGVAPEARPLLSPGTQAKAAAGESPLVLSWPDDALGIEVRVSVEEDLQGPAVVARVEGSGAELPGKAVSVALLEDKGYRLLRWTIPLETAGESDGHRVHGIRRLGGVAELREKLGERVTLDVFLLESP